MKHLGIIGTGNMGGAIALGAKDRNDISLYGFDPSQDRLASLQASCGLIPCEHLEVLCERSDYLLLAVKPHLVPEILYALQPHLTSSTCLISIAAGVSMAQLKTWSGTICPVMRVMPNTPALVGKGVFALCLEDERVTEAQKEFVQDVLSRMGRVHVLEERLFDAFTALVGSGPAYVLYVMEGLIDAGVSLGLGRHEATDMVKGLFSGSSKMAEMTDKHITQLKEMVTSPGGTTIAGLNKLEQQAVKYALYKGVKAAHDRSKKLSRPRKTRKDTEKKGKSIPQ